MPNVALQLINGKKSDNCSPQEEGTRLGMVLHALEDVTTAGRAIIEKIWQKGGARQVDKTEVECGMYTQKGEMEAKKEHTQQEENKDNAVQD